MYIEEEHIDEMRYILFADFRDELLTLARILEGISKGVVMNSGRCRCSSQIVARQSGIEDQSLNPATVVLAVKYRPSEDILT